MLTLPTEIMLSLNVSWITRGIAVSHDLFTTFADVVVIFTGYKRSLVPGNVVTVRVIG